MVIEDELYQQIVKSIPILCVDILVSIDKKFLLIKRNQNPLKGEWWVPGGRVLIGENCIDAAKRKLLEELNYHSDNLNIYGVYEDCFEESSFGIHKYHTVSIVYLVEATNIENIDLDYTSTDWKLHDKIPDRLNKKLTIIN